MTILVKLLERRLICKAPGESQQSKTKALTLAVHRISQQQNRIPKWAQRQELCVEDMLHATKQGLEQRWTDGDQGTG